MTSNTTNTRPGLWARLRTPKPAEQVQVTFTGTAQAVTAMARALAAVTVVTAMRHHVTAGPDEDNPTIRLELTCHPTTRVRGGAR